MLRVLAVVRRAQIPPFGRRRQQGPMRRAKPKDYLGHLAVFLVLVCGRFT
jgi:hypothetical protein